MPEQNIALIGFGSLEPAEIDAVNKVLETHAKKLQELTNYESLRLKLHSHQHLKSFIHEIQPRRSLGKRRPAFCKKE